MANLKVVIASNAEGSIKEEGTLRVEEKIGEIVRARLGAPAGDGKGEGGGMWWEVSVAVVQEDEGRGVVSG